MDIPSIAVALHELADALIRDTAKPVPTVAAEPAATPEPPPETIGKAPTKPSPEMPFEDFSAQIRAISAQMGPGALSPHLRPLLDRYANGNGLSQVPGVSREAFLAEIRALAG